MSNRVIVTGASGFIGRALCRHLVVSGLEVVALSRRPSRATELLGNEVKAVRWDAAACGDWAALADAALAIVNLAGENIAAGRWTKKKKQRITQSRINAGKAVVAAVEQAKNKPKVVVQASGVGCYGDRGDERLDESSSLGTGFLADVAGQWEQSIQPVASMGVRLATVRIGAVLGPTGGLLAAVRPMFRLFLGNWPGNGKQWFSWVHIEDVVAAIRFLIENADAHGPFNLVSPNPVISKEFYKQLGSALHRPVIFRVPAFALKLLLGQMAAELLLSGQRVMPRRLSQAGYEFKYPHLRSALEDIIKTSKHTQAD